MLFTALLSIASVAVAASIGSSNQTTQLQRDGRIDLRAASAQGTNLSQLLPITQDAVLRNNEPLSGNLHYTNFDTERNLSNTDIAYISCDSTDYNGDLGALELFNRARNNRNLTAIILYSRSSNFCNFEDTSSELQEEFPVYSMATKEESSAVLNEIKDVAMSPSQKRFVFIVAESNDRRGQGDGNRQPQNPLGPSPSTAVAMIILYSITGIITALFLVIIVTGAVRAHRHPDRYGPRDMLGRPRQSRARGLGRAILDTIPIVKFGEREPPKPTDVEMASTSETRNVNDETTGAAAAQTSEQNVSETQQPNNPTTETPRDVPTEQPSGIAPALGAGAVPAATVDNSTPEDSLGCSICTEDFEMGQDIRVLPCDHKFHPDCVDPWLLNVSGTCPLCRVDLRPATSASNDEDNQDGNPDTMPPPLQPETEPSHRRRSAFRDILSLRSRPNASAEERISALRRLREQRQNQSGDVAEPSNRSANASAEDVAAARRSRRISVRLSDVFGGRGRRAAQDDVPATAAESSPPTTSDRPTATEGQSASPGVVAAASAPETNTDTPGRP